MERDKNYHIYTATYVSPKGGIAEISIRIQDSPDVDLERMKNEVLDNDINQLARLLFSAPLNKPQFVEIEKPSNSNNNNNKVS